MASNTFVVDAADTISGIIESACVGFVSVVSTEGGAVGTGFGGNRATAKSAAVFISAIHIVVSEAAKQWLQAMHVFLSCTIF